MNPTFKVYSPVVDFSESCTGCALQLDFHVNKVGIGSIMMKIAPQSSPIDDRGEASFDWEDARLYTKLTVWESGHLLSVINEKRGSAKFTNRSHEGDIFVTINNTFDDDDISDLVMSFQSGTSRYLVAHVKPHQREILAIFLGEALSRLMFAVSDNPEAALPKRRSFSRSSATVRQ